MRYKADLTAGALKIAESRVIADLLLRGIAHQQWRDAILTQNILQVRHPATAIRLARLIRHRLELMDAGLWQLVRDGTSTVTSQALLAASAVRIRTLLHFSLKEVWTFTTPT